MKTTYNHNLVKDGKIVRSNLPSKEFNDIIKKINNIEKSSLIIIDGYGFIFDLYKIIDDVYVYDITIMDSDEVEFFNDMDKVRW